MNGQDGRFWRKYLGDMKTDIFRYYDEKWKDHNDRANQLIEKNDKAHEKIFNWLEGLPCKERKWMSPAIYGIYGLIGGGVAVAIKHLLFNGHP